MLARAAQRKLRRDAQAQLSQPLALPWLCPAQMRWAASVAFPRNPLDRQSSLPSLRRMPSTSLSPRRETRSLATTADLQPAPSESLSFQGFTQAWGSRMPDPELSKLPVWPKTGFRPLVVHDAMSESAPLARMKFGIGGNPMELHQNLYACLRVGRMDRATAIVQRLTELYNPAAPELVDAHNSYLQTTFELALASKDQEAHRSMATLERWYDHEMVRKLIQPNAQTFVTLLRASLNLLDDSAKVQSVQRYLQLAYEQGEDALEDVNASPEFTDEEWDELIRLQPDNFNEPPAVEEVQNIQFSTPAGQALAIQHGFIPAPKPDITPVSQKGMGLSTLKAALKSFEHPESVPYPHEMEGTQEEKDRAYQYMRQVRVEQDASEAATERWKAEDQKLQDMGIHGVLQSKPIQALMWNWYSALKPRLEAELEATKKVLSNPCAENNKDPRHIYGPYLEQFSASKAAAIAISRVVGACAQGRREDLSSLKISSLSLSICRSIEDDISRDAKARQKAYIRKTRSLARQELIQKLSKNKPGSQAEKTMEPRINVTTNTFSQKNFPINVRAQIGAMVLEQVMQSAMITVVREDPKTGKKLTSTQRAFLHHHSFAKGKKTGYIRPHHEILTKLRSEPVHNIQTVKLPMLVEPKPWSGFEDGGYYVLKEPAVRIKASDVNQQAYVASAIENGDMNQVLAGLDVLGKVPWKINREVFEVMAEAWNTDDGVGALVPGTDTLERPVEPPSDAPFDVRVKWNQALKEYENTKGGLHSMRCFQNFQLEIARAFLDEKIYYPHSVDFRGRAYPCPPILNHIGADLCRGLLKFANGKELGTVGLQWIRIHLANLYGYDKASFKDREHFAIDHMDDIRDSALYPLKGKRWWTKAEDPWQCLACCIELKNALESPDPTRYVCSMPVHQDGTCNGLQHYAALGGDHAGASQVNLEPSDRPQDIYTGVAELVRQLIAEDAKNDQLYAQVVQDKISRKVVKRTVMTNVYGVTFMGAKAQVQDELQAIFPNGVSDPNGTSISVHSLSLYVAKKIFLALGQIFNGAQDIQYWLGECGNRITTSLSAEQVRKIQERGQGKVSTFSSKYTAAKGIKGVTMQKTLDKATETFKQSIVWTTPLKMPVVQPYHKISTTLVKTNLQGIAVQKQNSTDAVDRRKQLQAFPPNFIHSLDATHMILSALKCHELGLDFAAVHDSFWTHAADIPNLSVILRDAFVRMHSEDIIGRLAAEFKARYAGSMYQATISSNTAVGKAISAWRLEKRSSIKKETGNNMEFGELALEAERQELLNSEDAEERTKGEAMVTPTSIWLEAQDPMTLVGSKQPLLGHQKAGAQSKESRDRVLGAEAEVVEEEGKKAGAQFAAQESKTQEVAANEADIQAAVDAELEAQAKDAEVEVEAEADAVDSAELDVEAEEEAPIEREKPKSTRGAAGTIKIWLPLTFPPVPKKGDWDVKRLRESKYFFS